MLTTSFLACLAPRLVAPAMNDRMYGAAATQANLATLRERGVAVIEPDSGALASRGEYGVGRLPAPERLLAEVEALLPSRRALGRSRGAGHGRRSASRSFGALHRQSLERTHGRRARRGRSAPGRAVTLVAANLAIPPPAGVEVIAVETTAQLDAEVRARVADAHVLLMAAAPADFRAADPEGSSLRDRGRLELRLEATEDILAGVAAGRTPGQTLVGLAAETGADAIERARAKLERKASTRSSSTMTRGPRSDSTWPTTR